MLLHNFRKLNSNSDEDLYSFSETQNPILIVCYTNHALDQLLVLIRKFIGLDDMVRIGGRSKEESLKECNLQFLRDHSENRRLQSFYKRREMLSNTIKSINTTLEELNKPNKKLNFYKIFKFCDDILWDSLFGDNFQRNNKNTVFMNWLGLGDEEYHHDQQKNMDDTVNENDVDGKEQARKACLKRDENVNQVEESIDNYNLEEAQLFNDQREIDEDVQQKQRIREMACAAMDQKPKQVEALEWRQVKSSNKKAPIDMNQDTRNQKKQMQLRNFYKYQGMNEDEVDRLSNLRDLNLIERIRFYKYLCNKYFDELNTKLVDLKEKYKENELQFSKCKDLQSYMLIKNKKVIGMTTTGAAKNQALVKLLKPKIVIVEEAAEVFESHIITCLTSSCEQLILIGDNEQLCPTANLYKLGKHFNMNVSLFERLDNNKIPKVRLNVQHRMRPEISFFMKYFYNDLVDNDSVKCFENINGIGKNIFFIDHRMKEEGDEESLTKSNIYEASFLTRLCDYLLKQNYSAEKITILVAYGGQLLLMKKTVSELAKSTTISSHPDLEKVRITPIDNYQGEENDIILLSLVRSNSFNSIGFLATSNRVCVAMSRAKKGFYLIGNFKHLAQNSKLWSNIVADAEKHKIIGETLNFVCQKHPDKRTEIKSVNDFEFCSNGGCNEICTERLECGHSCDQKCHVMNHDYFKCKKPCQRLFKKCSLDHTCSDLCFEECKECPLDVTKVLPSCGHSAVMKCSMNPDDFKCKELESLQLKCDHFKNIFCYKKKLYEDIKEKPKSKTNLNRYRSTLVPELDELLESEHFKCKEIIEKTFISCEHKLNIECFLRYYIECEVSVSKVLACGHSGVMKCCKDHHDYKCLELVPTELKCGHIKNIVCHKKKIYEKYKDSMDSKYFKLMPCNSQLVNLMQEFLCIDLVEKSFNCCNHVVKIECDKVNSVEHCPQIVRKELKCGHSLEMYCHKDPNQSNCNELVLMELDCGHSKEIECDKFIEYKTFKESNDELKINSLLRSEKFACEKIVEKQFQPCNHIVKVKCSENLCNVLVRKRIPQCGHTMNDVPCFQSPSTIRCIHKSHYFSQSNNKTNMNANEKNYERSNFYASNRFPRQNHAQDFNNNYNNKSLKDYFNAKEKNNETMRRSDNAGGYKRGGYRGGYARHENNGWRRQQTQYSTRQLTHALFERQFLISDSES